MVNRYCANRYGYKAKKIIKPRRNKQSGMQRSHIKENMNASKDAERRICQMLRPFCANTSGTGKLTAVVLAGAVIGAGLGIVIADYADNGLLDGSIFHGHYLPSEDILSEVDTSAPFLAHPLSFGAIAPINWGELDFGNLSLRDSVSNWQANYSFTILDGPDFVNLSSAGELQIRPALGDAGNYTINVGVLNESGKVIAEKELIINVDDYNGEEIPRDVNLRQLCPNIQLYNSRDAGIFLKTNGQVVLNPAHAWEGQIYNPHRGAVTNIHTNLSDVLHASWYVFNLDDESTYVLHLEIPQYHKIECLNETLLNSILHSLGESDARYTINSNTASITNCTHFDSMTLNLYQSYEGSTKLDVYFKGDITRNYEHLNKLFIPKEKITLPDVLEKCADLSREQFSDLLNNSQPVKYWKLPTTTNVTPETQYIVNMFAHYTKDVRPQATWANFNVTDFDSWCRNNSREKVINGSNLRRIITTLADYIVEKHDYVAENNTFVCYDYAAKFVQAYNYVRHKNRNLHATAAFLHGEYLKWAGDGHAFVGIVSTDGKRLYHSFVDPTWYDTNGEIDVLKKPLHLDALDKSHFS